MIFDTHAHYYDEAFDADREELLSSMADGGIGRIVNASEDRASSEKVIALTQRYDFMYGAVGIHPEDVEHERDISWIRPMLSEPKIAAIGEIGLDYHWDTPRDLQHRIFAEQLELALETDTPVIIHSREAAQDTYDIMKECGGDRISAVIHCFGYEKEMAARFMDLGYYIGVGGVVTYKNGRKLKEVVEAMPMDRLLLETDCPYLSPVPYRGKRNCSLYLHEVVDEIGRLRGLSAAQIEDITWENANRFYRI